MATYLPEIMVTSCHGAERILTDAVMAHTVRYLISIGSPGEPPPTGIEAVPERLRLELADVHAPGWPDAPHAGHIREIIDFARRLEEPEGTLLVHCQVGVSRSPAAAIIVAAALLGPGREAEAVQRVLDVAPQAMPNQLMIDIGDELLGRHGTLRRALDP